MSEPEQVPGPVAPTADQGDRRAVPDSTEPSKTPAAEAPTAETATTETPPHEAPPVTPRSSVAAKATPPAKTTPLARTTQPQEATLPAPAAEAAEPPPAPDVAAGAATPSQAARAMVEEALQPPRAIEDTATFVPRPGSPAAEPAVQAAREEAEAARAALAVEIANLRASARAAVDVKTKVKNLPSTLAQDPRKAIGIGAAGAGLGLLVRRMRRGRKAVPPTMLPPEVEAALGDTGGDVEKIREALNRGFTSYLEAQGAQAVKRRRIPGAVSLFVLPVAATAAREAIKRALASPRKS